MVRGIKRAVVWSRARQYNGRAVKDGILQWVIAIVGGLDDNKSCNNRRYTCHYFTEIKMFREVGMEHMLLWFYSRSRKDLQRVL